MTHDQLSMLLRDLDDCREPDFVLLGICADAMQGGSGWGQHERRAAWASMTL